MKKFLLYFTHFLFPLIGGAQVPRKIVVEHFTNTRCSICAGQNPGFYNNLKNQTGVIHLAIHPSSPYPACVLSQQNVTENDARTNYYGVYGSTPKLLINGVLLSSSTNYSSPSIFSPYQGLTSPFSMRIVQTKYGNDSLRSTVIIKTVASHTFTSLQLFVALAEDTLFYSAPNGETIHYDVFRKSLSGATGLSIPVTAAIGDSVIFTKSSATNTAWNFSRINTIAILQDATTKLVLQSESTSARSSVITGVERIKGDSDNLKVFVQNQNFKTIIITQPKVKSDLSFCLYEITGRVILKKTLLSETEVINVEDLSAGIYIYTLDTKNEIRKTGKLIVE